MSLSTFTYLADSCHKSIHVSFHSHFIRISLLVLCCIYCQTFLLFWLLSLSNFVVVRRFRKFSESQKLITITRRSRPEVFLFLERDVPKICNKCTVEHPCRNAISIKLLRNFIEIVIRHECSTVNLLLNFKTPFFKVARVVNLKLVFTD